MSTIKSISTDELVGDWASVSEPEYGWAMYRFPGTEKVYFMGGKTTEHSVDIEDFSGFVIAPFYDKDKKFRGIENTHHYSLTDIDVSKLEASFSCNYSEHNPENGSTKEEYEKLVADVLNTIEKGTFQKAVPARSKQVKLSEDFSPFALFNSLLGTYPNAFVYLLSTPQTGSWIGCTPETLLKIKDQKLSTLSLAGTRKSGSAGDFDFTSKETEEQAIVTLYIHHILEQYCTEIEADGPHVINAGNVSHLATYFSGQLKPGFQSDFLSIARNLHPTPAVCGMPLMASRDFLLSHENFDRALYSGFLGPVTSNSADLFVNLRCMQVFRHAALLYAGAGVVKGSVPEKEWYETEEKMNTLQRFL